MLLWPRGVRGEGAIYIYNTPTSSGESKGRTGGLALGGKDTFPLSRCLLLMSSEAGGGLKSN